MGYPFWSGVYVETDPASFSQAAQKLFIEHGYKVDALLEEGDPSQLAQMWKGLRGDGERLGWFTVFDGWLRVLGVGLDSPFAYPPLFDFSEIVFNLGVRAFDCGFIEEDKSWWFCYYKKGVPVDWYELPSRLLPRNLSRAPQYASRPVPNRTAFVDLGQPGSIGDVLMLPTFEPFVPLDEIIAGLSPQSAIRFMQDNLFLPNIREWDMWEFDRLLSNSPQELIIYLPFVDKGISAGVFVPSDHR